MLEDSPKIWDGSDLNQSVLNKISSDKFLIVLDVPPVLKEINTDDARANDLISLNSLQFSCIDATIPEQNVKKIDVPFRGQSMPVTSYTRDAQSEVTLTFAVDNNFNNYHFLWTWLDNLNHCKESIPTKDYYNPYGYHEDRIGSPFVETASNTDEARPFSVKDPSYKHSFFDYQTRIILRPLREYNEPIAEFTYTNAFITSLGELKFDYKKSDQLTCTFKFAFGQQYFKLLKYNNSKPEER